MYDADEIPRDADISRFEPGTSILATGDSGDATEFVYDLLSGASSRDEPVILITTNDDSELAVDAFEKRGAFSPEHVGIIDCTAQDAGQPHRDVLVERLASPGDLTGISLQVAKLVKRFGETDSGTGFRIGVATVSTMLMYNDTETVFRFLHVFTSRIRSGDWLGVFALEPGMHDQQTVNTVRAIFDCEVRLTEDGVDIQGAGFE